MQSTEIPTNAIIWNLEFNDGVKSIDQKPKNIYYPAENDIINLTRNNANRYNIKRCYNNHSKTAVYSEANFSSYATSDNVPFSVKFTS